MAWLASLSGHSIYPYCEIREANDGGAIAYELVITYASEVQSTERFPTLSEASRRAVEVGRFWRAHRVRAAAACDLKRLEG